MKTPGNTNIRSAIANAGQGLGRNLVCCDEHESEKLTYLIAGSCCTAIVGIYEL